MVQEWYGKERFQNMSIFLSMYIPFIDVTNNKNYFRSSIDTVQTLSKILLFVL